MLGPEYDSESKGLLDELLAVPSLESGGGGSLQRISAKRVAGRGPEAKTSKGFGKDMGMELGSLSGGKVEGPKAGVGSDMLELARQYKLKAKRAEDAARGLMRGTLGEPTLEQPTLLRGPLVKRRFQKGGEVLSSPEEQPVTEESSASKMLKRLVEPVREGAKGYFGFEPTESLNPTEAYQTGQAMANMPGVGAPAALGIFIGRGARGWNKAANAVAKKMEKQGATPDEIWQQTGNFKAPDGKWRQEISDQAAQHRGQVSRGPAGMVFKHPELYENYPELRDILVRTNPYETKSVLTAGGQPGAVIELGTAGGRTENARGMLHELQHDIQFREGFGLGGSELTAFRDPRAYKILKELRAKMAQPASLQEFARDAWKTDKITPEVKQSYQDYLGFRKTNAKNLDIEAQKTAARLYYERLLGEAESRAVEARQFLTPAERRLVLPSQSYKRDGGREIIPLEELIIKRAEGGEVLSSPEEQPVTEESSASRMLKQLMEPVREGAKGYFGAEPADVLNPTEAYRTGQAMANMPAVGAVAGAVGLGSRAIPAAKRLLLMPCSDMKCATPAEAKDLYKGVFYQTYRNQVRPGHEPQMMILSAKHGFVTPKQMLEPYNQKMTPKQAEDLVKTVKQSMGSVQWPEGIEEVMLVGGKHYQKVMNAAVEELKAQGRLTENVVVRSTKGEIGQQRQQLGQYLRGIAEEGGEPLSKSSGGFIADHLKPGGYAEGGDVSRETSESRSYLDELDARDDPIRSGRPLQSRTRRKATPEQNEALNRAALQGVANMPYNLVGAPVDLLNMLLTPTGLGSEKPVMGSDWIKQKMTDLGVRPEPPTDPTQRAVYSAADFASNFVNPAAPVRAAAKGAEKTGEAARMLAEDFQRYNQALGPAGASHVIKPKGGSWEQASVDRELNSIKRVDRYGLQSPEQTAEALGISVDEARKLWDPGDLALNTWIDRNLGNYIKRELASPKDPLRELAESGVLSARLAPFERAAAEDISNYPWLLKERPASGFPTEGMARGPDAKVWENMADSLLITMSAGNLPENILARQPGLRNLPPDEPVYKLRETAMYDIGFDHVVDVLRGDIQAGRLDPKRLDNLSVEQAVRRTDQFDKMMAKRQQQARIKAASDLPVVKQYDEGYRWLELKPKLADDWKPPENLEIFQPTPSAETWAIRDKNTDTVVAAGLASPEAAQKYLRDTALETRTKEVLKQEGDAMGHCIGSYCSDVMAGKSQNFSLRDASGEQHVTIEVKPALGYTQSEAAAAAQAEGLRGQEFANRVVDLMEGAGVPPRIAQIKGKGNAKPKGEYLPFVQDFIKSSNWSEVKDLRNAGMVQVTEGQRLPGFSKTIPPGFYTLDELRQMAVENEMPQEILDTWMSKLGDQLGRGFAQGGLVNASTARAQLDRLMAA